MLYYLCSRCQFKIQANKHICPTCGYKVPVQKPEQSDEHSAPRANAWLKMLGMGEKKEASHEKPALAE